MTVKEDQAARYWPTVRGWAKALNPGDWQATNGIQRQTTRRQCLNCGRRTSVVVRGFCLPCRERFP